jgi:acyl-CoA hydrolase
MKIPIVYQTAEEALNIIQSGNRVFVQGSSQTPTCLLKALTTHAPRLKDVELVFVTVFGKIHVDQPEYADSFKINALFVSEAIREDVNKGAADYVPVFLSEIPELFKHNVLPIDVALVQVSPPDRHGYCSLGMAVDVARSAVNTAKYVVAAVNPHVPRTHGDSLVHASRFHAFVKSDQPLYEAGYGDKIGPLEMKIGENIASLIDDRCTLQMGIGSIPDAVLRLLKNHKDLGIHTEMCSDGIIDLVECDVINNRYKQIHPNKTVTAFALGTRRLYDYVDDNPAFQFLDIDYVNNPQVIARNPKMIAINSAIEIDVTGQVCADSIGTFQYSGVGGQMDFMRGAAESAGGKPIIALPSRTIKGVPRIVPTLKPGAGVVTTRAHVHYVVTEYGIAYLFGKNLRQRAKALIDIAHPDDREELERACCERFKIF